jgi:hypothetical protein
MNAEMKELLEALGAKLAPMVDAAVKDAVAVAGGPLVASVADPVIDAVDAYVMALMGTAPPANAVAAPTDADSRMTALEKHVAALTVASGHASSSAMVATKVAAVKIAPPETDAPAP